MNLDLSFYFAVFLRRIHYFILFTVLGSATAIAVAMMLPRVYQAQTLLSVDSSQIPGALAAPTVQAAALEKLQNIQNRLMTRANLLDIANRLGVYKDAKDMLPDDIVQAMNTDTNIVNNTGKGQATFMQITFNARTGKIAANVLNEYVTLILKDDAETRTKGAEETLDFFNQEVKGLGSTLDQISAKILDFQNKNSDALPSTLAFRMQQQQSLQGKIDGLDQSIKQLTDQKDNLITMFKATGQVSASGANMTPEAKQLEALNNQLNQSLALLSPANPKIKSLQAQIAQLQVIVRTQQGGTDGSTDPATSMFNAQIKDFDARIADAKTQRDQASQQLDALNQTIAKTPANQIALDALNRDYANALSQYNSAVSRQSQAAMAEKTEALSKGEKISVVDAASPPEVPLKPKRTKIAVAGTAGGMVAGLGLIALLELLNRAVRRPVDIVKTFGITPIVAIPYMQTPSETMRRRSVFAATLLFAVIGIPSLLYLVHVYVMPLDIILSTVAGKFGINL